MSEWRDIWKESLKANQLFAEDEDDGLTEFACLLREYGEDGMIHYAMGEALELKGNYNDALLEYKKAKELFPVKHWEIIAEDTIKRVSQKKTAEQFFDRDDFEECLWYGFQKIYEFVNLSSFVRYICLSAISRATSEWPLSLVDFRTVLEILLKTFFPEIEEYVRNENYKNEFYLSKAVFELKKKKYINTEVFDMMMKIIHDGNEGAHEPKEDMLKNTESICNFINIVSWFNNHMN